jgi:hypothetical protein
VRQERRQQQPLLGALACDSAAVPPDLERAEDREVHLREVPKRPYIGVAAHGLYRRLTASLPPRSMVLASDHLPAREEHQMSKIVAVLAVLMFAFATATASASAVQDVRSPDARPAAGQDYRSPDSQRPSPVRTTAGAADLRSPDARPSGRFAATLPAASASGTSGSFDWGYLALASAAALVLLAGLVVTQRRRRHGLAIGS